MKLPALWIAAAFAAGIGIITRWPHQPLMYAAVAALAILAGSILHLAASSFRVSYLRARSVDCTRWPCARNREGCGARESRDAPDRGESY